MGDSPREDAHHAAGPFTLPSIATMTRGMPKPDSSPQQKNANSDMMRDSGMWSMQSPSKHSQEQDRRDAHIDADSSTVSSVAGLSTTSSNTGLQLHTILNNDDSHRFSAASSSTPASARFSRDQPSTLPALNQGFEGNRVSIDANNTSFLDSRRSSIDSRINVHIAQQLSTSSNSPRDGGHASYTSAPTTHPTQSMRPPNQHIRPPTSAFSPVQSRRPVTSGGQPPRRAPPISANPRSGGAPNPMAATPTKGFAWAFPDTPDKDEDGTMTPDSSRQGSMVSSLNAMDATPWKHEAGPDGHHGPLQHRSLSNLQVQGQGIGTGSYSRTPELRVSHKLAERKRRSEMKDLFEDLNRQLPNAPGNKASKWEILSKAIDYIHNLKAAYDNGQRDNEKLRAELEHARAAVEENHHLQGEITAMHQQLHRVDPSGHHIFGPRTQLLEQQQSQTPGGRVTAVQSPAAGGYGAAMQGVEYERQGHYERR